MKSINQQMQKKDKEKINNILIYYNNLLKSRLRLKYTLVYFFYIKISTTQIKFVVINNAFLIKFQFNYIYSHYFFTSSIKISNTPPQSKSFSLENNK